MARKVFVSLAVNWKYPLLLTVFQESSPAFQALFWNLDRPLTATMARLLFRSESFHFTCSVTALQLVVAAVPCMEKSIPKGATTVSVIVLEFMGTATQPDRSGVIWHVTKSPLLMLVLVYIALVPVWTVAPLTIHLKMGFTPALEVLAIKLPPL